MGAWLTTALGHNELYLQNGRCDFEKHDLIICIYNWKSSFKGKQAIPALNGISNEKFVLSVDEWTKYISTTAPIKQG